MNELEQLRAFAEHNRRAAWEEVLAWLRTRLEQKEAVGEKAIASALRDEIDTMEMGVSSQIGQLGGYGYSQRQAGWNAAVNFLRKIGAEMDSGSELETFNLFVDMVAKARP